MKLGDLEYFCNCILKSGKDHVTAVDEDQICVYCGYYSAPRKVTPKDIRRNEQYGTLIEELKQEHLDLIIKAKRHKEKIQ